MAKIIRITSDEVEVGLESGEIRTFNRNDLNQSAQIGDTVEIYESAGKTRIIIKQNANRDPQIIINNDTSMGGISPKSRAGAAILCFFFGIFGIHRFYAGKIGTGLLWEYLVLELS